MDHPCHKCGHSIEDGKPFCAECGAPQIRVLVPDAPAESVAAGQTILPAIVHKGGPAFPATTIAALPGFHTVRPCALAAGIAALLMFLGLNPFVAALAAGFLAGTYFQRGSSGIAIRPAGGARLGALSALMLFGIATILETAAVVFLHKGVEIRSQVMEKIQQAAGRYPGSDIQPFMDFVSSPAGFAFLIGASLIFGLMAFVILGGVGGAISAAFSGGRNRR
jgi:hypothetical protein